MRRIDERAPGGATGEQTQITGALKAYIHGSRLRVLNGPSFEAVGESIRVPCAPGFGWRARGECDRCQSARSGGSRQSCTLPHDQADGEVSAMTRTILTRCFLVAACWLSSAPLAAATDDVCDRVAKFHRAGFDHTEQPDGRRWVEMHWTGHWLDFDQSFGLKCKSSPDSAARELCGWLIDHTSTEFPDNLPQRVLTCYGHRFPRHAHWSGWKSDISFFAGDRLLLLEIDLLTMHNETGAIRLSSFAPGKDDALVEMPPLAEFGVTASPPRND